MISEAQDKSIRELCAPLLHSAPASLLLKDLGGHASARSYVRVRSSALRSLMVMVLPDDPMRSEEGGAGALPEELPFVSVQRYLKGLGVRVPEIHAVDLQAGLLVLEDLGDISLEAAARAEGGTRRMKHYGAAVDTLAFLRVEAARQSPQGTIIASRSFDKTLLRWELDHFREWLLEAQAGATLNPEESAHLEASFDGIAERLASLPQGLTHRDYQSRNLFVVADEIAVIDFQDALMGPLAYDLVALLRDSYLRLDWGEVEHLKARYLDALRSLGQTPPSPAEFDEAFDLQTVQRKLKDAGRFVYIDRVKKNPSFLPSIPASLAYAREALTRLPELAELQALLGRYVPELKA